VPVFAKDKFSAMKEGFDQSGPFFSVIIPVYNAEGFIRECLNSLLDQDFTNWEAVMVDDCSKDRSLKLIEEMVGHIAASEFSGMRRIKGPRLPGTSRSTRPGAYGVVSSTAITR